MTEKEKSRLETGSNARNQYLQHIKNYNTYKKKSSLRDYTPYFWLLPGKGIGQLPADEDPSTCQDSIQGRGWSLALQAILQPFLLDILSNYPGRTKAKIRLPCGRS